MTSQLTKSIAIIVAIAVLILIALMFRGEPHQFVHERPEIEVTATNTIAEPMQVDRMTLSSALTAAGVGCEKVDFTYYCVLNGTEYEVIVPPDWRTDEKNREAACIQGYVNDGYSILTDGAEWYATTNFNRDLLHLERALESVGMESFTASYCGSK